MRKQRKALRFLYGLLPILAIGVAEAQQNPRQSNRSDGPDLTALDHALEAYISDDALQAQYIRVMDFGRVGNSLDVRGGFFYNEDGDLIINGDILAPLGNPTTRRQLEVRVGARAYGAFIAIENQDVFGLGLGGEVEYYFGRDRRTSAKLSFYYAPDIMTFGQSDDINDITLRLQTRIREGTDVFVGFRVFEIDLDVGDREVDDNMHVGFRRSF